jgi:hypothetical protein
MTVQDQSVVSQAAVPVLVVVVVQLLSPARVQVNCVAYVGLSVISCAICWPC